MLTAIHMGFVMSILDNAIATVTGIHGLIVQVFVNIAGFSQKMPILYSMADCFDMLFFSFYSSGIVFG